MGAFSDLIDQVATLPAEMLILIVAAVMVGGFAMTLRRS
jgi:hypothetical protein